MRRAFILFMAILVLSGCSSNASNNVTTKEEIKEIVKFESVEDAELYLWETAKKDLAYSEIEKILSDGSFVSKTDYERVVNWYEELERTNEIVQNSHKDMADWTVEKGMFLKKDGGLITRYQNQAVGGFIGYEVNFISEDGTYKLEKITMLQ